MRFLGSQNDLLRALNIHLLSDHCSVSKRKEEVTSDELANSLKYPGDV